MSGGQLLWREGYGLSASLTHNTSSLSVCLMANYSGERDMACQLVKHTMIVVSCVSGGLSIWRKGYGLSASLTHKPRARSLAPGPEGADARLCI